MNALACVVPLDPVKACPKKVEGHRALSPKWNDLAIRWDPSRLERSLRIYIICQSWWGGAGVHCSGERESWFVRGCENTSPVLA